MTAPRSDPVPGLVCPRCGRRVVQLVGGTCTNCLLQTGEAIGLAPFRLRVCPDCLRYKHENVWRKGGDDLASTLAKAARDELPRRIRVREYMTSGPGPAAWKPRIDSLQITRTQISRNKAVFEVIASMGQIRGEEGSADVVLRPSVAMDKSLCQACELRRSDFFACLLQLRADRRPLGDEEILSATSLAQEGSLARARDAMGFLGKIVDKKEGRDFYLGSTSRARDIAGRIIAQWGGILHESRKLIGVEKGSNRKLYKFTLSVRLPRLRKGDITMYNGILHAVHHIHGTRATLVGLRETITVDTALTGELPLVERREQVGEALVLEVRPDGIQILDPKTNATFDLDNALPGVRVGETVRVVWVDDVPKAVPDARQEAAG